MKINIKDVFEKDGGTVNVHTNDRLNMDEVFAEALQEDYPGQKQPDNEAAESEEMLQEETASVPEEAVSDTDREQNAPEKTETPERKEITGTEGSEISEEKEAREDTAGENRSGAHGEEVRQETVVETESPKTANSAETVEISDNANLPDDVENIEKTAEEEPDVKAEEGKAALYDESIDDNESTADEETKDAKPAAATFLEMLKAYGWHTGIAAVFVILIAVMIIYTTMTPREVNATINGEEFEFSSKAYTVEKFMEEENIEFCSDDYISLPMETFIYDGIKLEIKHATDFSVTADGSTESYKSLANTVEEALKDIGVKVGDKDIVEPGKEELLTSDMEIIIRRVVIRKETAEEDVPFKTVEKDDDSIDEGTTKVVTKGVKGKDKVTYEVTYTDGKETSRKEVDRKHVKKAVDKVVANGTRISFNGQAYSRKIVVKAYAYTGGGRTAMGTQARVGEIAVDPSVIPLGSNVYIEGVGARRAEDTGGNIQGNTIDIYMDTQGECINWGARYVTIYIQ